MDDPISMPNDSVMAAVALALVLAAYVIGILI